MSRVVRGAFNVSLVFGSVLMAGMVGLLPLGCGSGEAKEKERVGAGGSGSPVTRSACERACDNLVSECTDSAADGECVERCEEDAGMAERIGCEAEFDGLLGCCAGVNIDEDIASECEDGGSEVFEECEQACETWGDDVTSCLNRNSLGDAGANGNGGSGGSGTSGGSSGETGGGGGSSGSGTSGTTGSGGSGGSGTTGSDVVCNGTAFSRTDVTGTAICLDGANSFECAWKSYNPHIDGYVADGSFDATANELRLNLPRDPYHRNFDEFLFETTFEEEGAKLTLMYDGERQGVYRREPSWAVATPDDNGLCDTFGNSVVGCGARGQYELLEVGTDALWDDHVRNTETGLTWNYGVRRASDVFPECTSQAEGPPCCELRSGYDSPPPEGYVVACLYDAAAEFCDSELARLPTRAEIAEIQPDFSCVVPGFSSSAWTSTEAESAGRAYTLMNSSGVIQDTDTSSKTLFPFGVLCVRD